MLMQDRSSRVVEADFTIKTGNNRQGSPIRKCMTESNDGINQRKAKSRSLSASKLFGGSRSRSNSRSRKDLTSTLALSSLRKTRSSSYNGEPLFIIKQANQEC